MVSLRGRHWEASGYGVSAILVNQLPAGLGLWSDSGERFDLVFADPPYSWHHYETLLAAVEPLLAVDGELALEHSSRVETPLEAAGIVRSAQRRYGESSLSFFRSVAPPKQRRR